MRLFFISALLLNIIFISGGAVGQVPGTIGYQGRLSDSEGNPVNGQVDMTFRLFNGRSGGSILWEETQSSVNIEDGFFSVSLGSVTPFSLDFKSQYFLEIQVGSDDPMSPRIKLESTPYTERAAAAPRIVVSDANGVPISDILSLHSKGAVDILSEKGYIFALKRSTGTLLQSPAILYFGSTDCSGFAVGTTSAGSTQDPDFEYAPGIVFAKGPTAYFIPRTAVPVNGPFGYGSFYDGDMTTATCTASPGFLGAEFDLYQIQINDPDVTGVTQTSWPAPLTIDIVQGEAARN